MFGSQDTAHGDRGQGGLRLVIERPLPRPPPLLAWSCGLTADEAPRHHSDRKADSQEPCEVVRPDIDRVEMHREASTIIVSCAPGAKATITSAIRNGSSATTTSANDAATATATANEPKAAARYPSSILGLVFANLAPATAPSVSTAAPPAHQGSDTWIK